MSQMPPQYQSGYSHAPVEAPGATGGLVLGILSIVFVVPLLGLIMPLIGLTMARSAKAMVEHNPGAYSNGGVATAGYVCCIVGLVLNGLSSLCGCGYFIFVILAIGGAAASGGGGGF